MMKKTVLNYQLDFNRCLGQGAQGQVVVAVNLNTKEEVAVKIINKKKVQHDQYTKRALFSEIQIIKCLKSENIVQFYEQIMDKENYYIIQQLCESDLRDLIYKKKRIFSEKQCINILFDICNGFSAILKEGIIHRDLKPQNILIKKNKFKIADFGLSKKIYNKRYKTLSSVGTPVYMSLELLKNQPYSSKCDIWALGIIFYQLLHGKVPWQAYTEYELVRNTQKIPLKISQSLSQTTRDFLKKCLQLHQKDRMSWDELFRHEIFAQKFQNFLKQEDFLQDKFRAYMNELKYLITSQNIDLEELFEKKGYKKSTALTFKHFQQFLKTLNCNISSEQQIYIFQRLDFDDSNTITFNELEQEFTKYHIPLYSLREIPLEPIRCQAQIYQFQVKKKSVQDKIIQFFYKIDKRIKKYNLTLEQVFQAYDLDQDGFLNQQEFINILTRIHKNINMDEATFAFDLLDVKKEQIIAYQDFQEIFIKSTGKVHNDFMSVRKDSNQILAK